MSSMAEPVVIFSPNLYFSCVHKDKNQCAFGDDPGILATNIYNEYGNVWSYLIHEKSQNFEDAMDVPKGINQMSEEQESEIRFFVRMPVYAKLEKFCRKHTFCDKILGFCRKNIVGVNFFSRFAKTVTNEWRQNFFSTKPDHVRVLSCRGI